jgi:hypothetical protein
MNEPTDQPAPRFLTCRCQHCDGHIEFDASGFQEGDTATVKCSDCLFDTKIIVPVSTPESQQEKKPSSQSFRRFLHSVNWVQTLLTSRFERVVFAIIRVFAMFLAALLVLALIGATINYLRGFPDQNKEPDANQVGFWEHIFQSHAWQNFGIYALAVFFILFVLTIINFVLLLLAIERNTRQKD